MIPQYPVPPPPVLSFPYKKNLFKVSSYLPARKLCSPDFPAVKVVM